MRIPENIKNRLKRDLVLGVFVGAIIIIVQLLKIFF